MEEQSGRHWIKDQATNTSKQNLYLGRYDNMNTDLSFITNEENKSLRERFEILIKDTAIFNCLVGYFYSSGFHAIYKSLENTEKIRILIGISTNRQTFELMEMANKPTHQTFDFSHAEAKQEVGNLVQKEMEDSEDNKDIEDGIHRFIEWIKSDVSLNWI